MRVRRPPTRSLRDLVAATGSSLLQLKGIGPTGAARLLVDVGDFTRFPDRGHFASWNGTAAIDASSGDHVRHRLWRAGSRQINRILTSWPSSSSEPRPWAATTSTVRKADGKSSMEAMRALKRRLSDIVFRLMLDDAIGHPSQHEDGPGRATGQRLLLQRDRLTAPTPALRIKPLPEPVNHQA